MILSFVSGGGVGACGSGVGAVWERREYEIVQTIGNFLFILLLKREVQVFCCRDLFDGVRRISSKVRIPLPRGLGKTRNHHAL